jgi:type VI secretion system protein VasI
MAQTGVAQCVALEGDAERLACYDGLFRSNGEEAGALSVVIESEQLIPARPAGREPATMTISCEADVLTIAFAFAGNTMSALGRDAGLTLQSDLQPARSRTLPVNSTNTAILLNNTRDAAALLDSLAGTTNLTARVTPVNSRSLSVRFRVDAIMTEVEPVRAACGV